MKRLMLAAALAALTIDTTGYAATTTGSDDEKERGSLYLRCDGNPNNVTGGESLARFIGAVTLLAIFAPKPEAPDPSKRLFGDAGVDACSQLIDGEKAEGNGLRRVPLILARAVHQIEAKNYEAAINDVAKARKEAADLGLVGNPYFDRSMGLSFGNIEAEALLRLGKPEEAQKVSLSRFGGAQYSYVPLVYAQDYNQYLHTLTPEAEQLGRAKARIISPADLVGYAGELEETGRFADAAKKREALVDLFEGFKPDEAASIPYASAAVSHALAGEWDLAGQRAKFARDNMEQRRAKGVPDLDQASVVELLDLYDVLRAAHDGDLDKARLQFAARSQWLAPSFGQVMEADRRLRDGAAQAQLFGALAKSPDEMWQERRDNLLAAKLKQDTDNKTLFLLIVPYAKVDEFEGRTKDTWRTDKSKMMLDKPNEKSGLWAVYALGNPQTRFDSVVLHAALQARSRGKEGFVVYMRTERGLSMGMTRFLNRDELHGDDTLFVDANAAIAELSQVIPDPAELQRRKQQRR